jgi:hypothetical protein
MWRNVYLGRDMRAGISVRKPEGKRPLGRVRGRWEDNLKMYLKIGRGGRELTLLAYDRVNGGLLCPWNP